VGGQEGVREDGQSQAADLAAAGHSRMFRINHAFTPSYIPLRVIEKVNKYPHHTINKVYFLYSCQMQSYLITITYGLAAKHTWLEGMQGFFFTFLEGFVCG